MPLVPERRYQVRKRPGQERAKITCDAILEAAAHILVEEGYPGLTTNRIADRAGVSIGSLYQYYPNKEAVVARLIELHVEEDRRFLNDLLQRLAEAPLEEAIRYLVGAMLSRCEADLATAVAVREQVPRVGWTEGVREATTSYVELVCDVLRPRLSGVTQERLHMAVFQAIHAADGVVSATVFERPEWIANDGFRELLVQLLLQHLNNLTGAVEAALPVTDENRDR